MGIGAALRVVDGLRIADVGASAAAASAEVAVGLDGGRRRVCEVAVGGAVAVVHGADEAAWAAIALLASASAAALALEAADGVAGLVGVLVAIATAAAVVAVSARAGLVAGILRATRAFAVAELLLPALGCGGALLLLACAVLLILRLAGGGGAGLDVADWLTAGACLRAAFGFTLALAAAATAALGLAHAVGARESAILG